MIRYFDASALVKKYVEEQGSDLVRDRLLDGRAATSDGRLNLAARAMGLSV